MRKLCPKSTQTNKAKSKSVKSKTIKNIKYEPIPTHIMLEFFAEAKNYLIF